MIKAFMKRYSGGDSIFNFKAGEVDQQTKKNRIRDGEFRRAQDIPRDSLIKCCIMVEKNVLQCSNRLKKKKKNTVVVSVTKNLGYIT